MYADEPHLVVYSSKVAYVMFMIEARLQNQRNSEKLNLLWSSVKGYVGSRHSVMPK